MAKEIKKDEGEVIDPRQEKWEKFLANYAIKNPVKFAKKKDRGEFDKIPSYFK